MTPLTLLCIPLTACLLFAQQPRPGSLISMEFFKPFESKGVKLSVREGERKQVELTVLSGR